MPREIRPATAQQSQDVALAIGHLRAARKLLKRADCPQAARKVRRALKSADGAQRHVTHRVARSVAR